MELIVDKFSWESYESNKTLILACDGSSLGNPGAGGYAWYHSSELYGVGAERFATNNQMELSAVKSLLENLPAGIKIHLQLDSKYVIDSLTKYIYAWRKNGFKTSKGTPVANKELIETISHLLSLRKGRVTFEWVRGHAGHKLNEKADELATKAARSNKI